MYYYIKNWNEITTNLFRSSFYFTNFLRTFRLQIFFQKL